MKSKYGVDSESYEMLLFLIENSMQGRIKMIDNGIMDKG